MLFGRAGLFSRLPSGSSGGIDTKTIQIEIDGAGSAITTGIKNSVASLDIAGTITKWRLMTDLSSTCSLEVLKDTFNNYPPTEIDDIGSVSVTAGDKAESTDLSSWNSTSVSVGDVIKVNVVSNNNATNIKLELTVEV